MFSAGVDDGLGRARDALGAAASADLGGWTVTAKGNRIQDVAGLWERAEAELIRTVAGWEAEQGYVVDGHMTARSWLCERAGMDRGVAGRVVRAARLVHRFPTLAAALAAGDITCGHLHVLARHATARRLEWFADGLDGPGGLLAQARALSVDRLGIVMATWAAYVDDLLDDRPPPDEDVNRLHVSDLLDGRGRVDGSLDAEGLAVLREALAAFLPAPCPEAPEGARSFASRQAEALVAMARHALTVTATGRPRPAATVLILTEPGVLDGSADPAEVAWRQTCTIIGHGPLAPAAIRRLTCDSWLARVVMGADGEVLDLGRRARLFSDAQRTAIYARHPGGCVWPGCQAPLDRCQLHHVNPYGPPTFGATDLDNGVPLCDWHHRHVHDRGWTLHRRNDGTWDATPPLGHPTSRRPPPPPPRHQPPPTGTPPDRSPPGHGPPRHRPPSQPPGHEPTEHRPAA